MWKKLLSDIDIDNDFHNKIKQSVTSKTEVERNSILNDYVKINPLLISPSFYTQYTIKEYDRLIITKYRRGLHFLKIQTGRYTQLGTVSAIV